MDENEVNDLIHRLKLLKHDFLGVFKADNFPKILKPNSIIFVNHQLLTMLEHIGSYYASKTRIWFLPILCGNLYCFIRTYIKDWFLPKEKLSYVNFQKASPFNVKTQNYVDYFVVMLLIWYSVFSAFLNVLIIIWYSLLFVWWWSNTMLVWKKFNFFEIYIFFYTQNEWTANQYRFSSFHNYSQKYPQSDEKHQNEDKLKFIRIYVKFHGWNCQLEFACLTKSSGALNSASSLSSQYFHHLFCLSFQHFWFGAVAFVTIYQ